MRRQIFTRLDRRSLLQVLAASAGVLVTHGLPLRRASAGPAPAAGDDPDPSKLQPGEFFWHPDRAPAGPVVIIVSMVGDDNKITDQENYAACWCAIENLLVAANARGLGSYPSTGAWIDQNFVGPILGLTEKERPVACIFLGYSEQATMAKRLPVDRHTTWYTE